jgi:long-subunit fatty acid transport protein
MTFMPSVAYRVSPQISVGAGLGIMYATYKDKVAIPNSQLFDPLPDGQLNLEDHDWGFNGKFGILYEPTKATRFGVTYTTQTVLNFSSNLEWSGLRPGLDNILASRGRLNGQLNLGMRAPQAVMVSAFHDVTDRLALWPASAGSNGRSSGRSMLASSTIPPKASRRIWITRTRGTAWGPSTGCPTLALSAGWPTTVPC